ncbi:MAG: membrane protein insertase YidC [Chloroflexi bacterium]|nr:membrane protein insertase YidC [Chloroflexota bacterium]
MDIVGLWNFLLVHPLLSLLAFWYGIFPDFGLAIVGVTLLIRLLLYPLFVAQIRSQRAMQELAPALQEMRTRYGKDKQRVAEEQMKLYREKGVNPAAGCLPLLLQMPILFAMYSAFIQAGCGLGRDLGANCAGALTAGEIDRIRFWFLSNPLAEGERLSTAANWLPWIPGLQNPDPLYVLPILAGVTQLIASLMAQPLNAAKSDDPQVRMMQSMTYYFPIITVVISASFPAGLAVYWVATTVFQIVQQYFLTGWGQLARWLPFLRETPSPADSEIAKSQKAAIREVEADMGGAAGGETGGDADDRRSRRRRRRGR